MVGFGLVFKIKKTCICRSFFVKRNYFFLRLAVFFLAAGFFFITFFLAAGFFFITFFLAAGFFFITFFLAAGFFFTGIQYTTFHFGILYYVFDETMVHTKWYT